MRAAGRMRISPATVVFYGCTRKFNNTAPPPPRRGRPVRRSPLRVAVWREESFTLLLQHPFFYHLKVKVNFDTEAVTKDR